MVKQRYVLGIDVGTSGVKAIVLAEDGQIAARGAATLPEPQIDGKCREQDARLWWKTAREAIGTACKELHTNGGSPAQISSIAIDGTSGTIVPVDADTKPLRLGMMYNDGRSVEEAAALNQSGEDVLERLGYRFNASFSLAKILWLHRNEPKIIKKTHCILHQADYIAAKLTGGLCSSDESNALKSGYDILERRWPSYIEEAGINHKILPEVVPIGGKIGSVGKDAHEEFGLSPDCCLVGGMSDGTAACVASGAKKEGDGNTTLGTTIVWKIISSQLVCDPQGRLYSHRHPGGGFLPGGAGNSGGQGLRHMLSTETNDVDDLLQSLANQLKDETFSETVTYPLPSPGERFPFINPGFEAFTTVPPGNPLALYRSALEGIACIECWGYEMAESLGAEGGGDVWTTGKGAELDVWMQMRADILGRPVCRAENPESAYGTALVAAMNSWFNGSWVDTADNMIQIGLRCEPHTKNQDAAKEVYARFREACAQRGQIE